MYTTAAAILARFDSALTVSLFDKNGDGAADTAVLEAQIVNADSDIDGYVGVVMATPLSSPYPPNIVTVSQDLTIIRGFRDAGNLPEMWAARERAIFDWLKDIAAGRVILSGSSTTPSSPSAGSSACGASDRVFDDSSW